MKLLPCVLLALLWLSGPVLGQSVRLAVIGDPALDETAGLLAVQLSKQEGVTLLDRSNVDKILREQTLQVRGLTVPGSVKLGQLLKSDGLILLEAENTGEQKLLSMRLVAVNSGAIISVYSDTMPLPKPDAWCQTRAQEIARLASKFALRKKDAIPVFILRIKSLFAGPRSLAAEQAVNTLLGARLVQQPSVVVLERWRLKESVAEKVFSAENEPFWSSAWVIDGVVTDSGSAVAIELRLQPPAGGAPIAIKVRKPDVASAIEAAVAEITDALGQKAVPATWKLEDESMRHFQEAKAAWSNGLHEQALASVEASIALGGVSLDHLRLRWDCYARLARDLPGIGQALGVASEPGKSVPALWQIRYAVCSLELFRDALGAAKIAPDAGISPRPPGFPAGPPGSVPGRRLWQTPWVRDGQAMLVLGNDFLTAFGSEKPASLGSERLVALGDVRHLVREIFDTMTKRIPGLALKARSNNALPSLESSESRFPGFSDPSGSASNVFLLRFHSGESWENSPDDFFAYVRQCFTSELADEPSFYARLLEPDQRMLRFTGLAAPSGPGWMKFADRLCNDEDLRCQVAGAYALLRQNHEPSKALDVFVRNKHLIPPGTLPLSYLDRACRFLSDDNSSPTKAWENDKPLAWSKVKEVLIYLFNNDFPPLGDVNHLIYSAEFSKADAGELWQAVHAFRERQNAKPISLNAQEFHRQLSNVFAKKSGRALEEAPPSSAVTSSAPAAPNLAPIVKVPSLPVSHRWIARSGDGKLGEVVCVLFRAGKLWAQVEYQGDGNTRTREFVTLELPSLKANFLYRDVTKGSAPRMMSEQWPSFATDGTSIYTWKNGNVTCVRDGKSSDLTLPQMAGAAMWMIGDRLYLAGREGVIMRVNPVDGRYEVLASSRRQPPQSLLDGMPLLHMIGRIFQGADGSPTISMWPSKSFAYDEREHDWKNPGDFQGGELFSRKEAIARLQGCWDANHLYPASDYLQKLLGDFERVGRTPQGIVDLGKYYTGVRMRQTDEHTWQHTVTVCGGVAEGENLCALLEVRDDNTLCLLRVPPKPAPVVRRRLEFDPVMGSTSKGAADSPTKLLGGNVKLIPTPEGLAFYSESSSTTYPAVWFVPRSVLDGAFSSE